MSSPRRRPLRALLWTLLLALLAPSPGHAGLLDLPTDDGVPVRVYPRLITEKISDISDKDNTFSAEISLALQWKDGRLAFDPVVEAREQKEYLNDDARTQLASIWQPQVVVQNAAEAPRTLSTTLIIRSDGTVRLRQRMAIKTRMEFELQDYPFDRQYLTFQLASVVYGRESVMLTNDPVPMPSNLVIKNWQFERLRQESLERLGITGRPFSNLDVSLVVDRQSYVAVTQIFLPYLAIMFLPLISLFNVGGNTPTQLFTALLALLTLNFKIVLEEPVIASVSNSVVDAMWMGYCYIGVVLLLALSVMRAPGDRKIGDFMTEVRGYTKWGPSLIFLTLLGGRIAAAL